MALRIYAGIIDTDELGNRSVRDDNYIEVIMGAISSGVSNSQYSTYNFPYGTLLPYPATGFSNHTNVLDAPSTSMWEIYEDLLGLTAGTNTVADIPTNTVISFFLGENIALELGFKLYIDYVDETHRKFYLSNKNYDLYMAFFDEVNTLTSFVLPNYAGFTGDVAMSKRACFNIPYRYKDYTSFGAILEDMVSAITTSYSNETYDFLPIAIINFPFFVGYPITHRYWQGGDNYMALGAREIADVPAVEYRPTLIRNLNTVANWYKFFYNEDISVNPFWFAEPKGDYYLELAEPRFGIDKIYFTLPIYVASGEGGYSIEYDEGRFVENVGYSIKEYSIGTNIMQLFPLLIDGITSTVAFKNGATLSCTLNGTALHFVFTASEKTLEFDFTGTDNFNDGYGIYMVAPYTFAELDSEEWLEALTDFNTYEYGNCPIAMASYIGVPYTGLNAISQLAPFKTNFWNETSYSGVGSPGLALLFSASSHEIGDYDSINSNPNYEFWESLLSNLPGPSPKPPYNPGEGSQGGGYSGEGGGQGGYDDTDEGIGDHASPVDLSGMASFMLYAGDIGDIDSLIDYYSNPDYHITDDWRNKIQNAICSTKLYALPSGAHFKTGTDGGIKVGGWSIGDIHMKPVESQYVVMGTGTAETANMLLGTFKIEEYFGSFLDYAPYTKIQIYLPFVGVKDLDVNEIMGRECSLTCTIDLFTGNIVYKLSVENRHTAPGDYDKSVLYTFDGNVAIDIPLGQKDFADKVGMYINTCMSLGGLGLVGASVIATGGATAPLAVVGSAMGTLSALGQQFHEISKASVPKSYIRNGNNTSNNGFSAPNVAFLMITRPKQNIPETFAHEYGFKSHISARLGDLTGFTKVEAIKLEGIPYLDQDELAELEEILKSGIIL